MGPLHTVGAGMAIETVEPLLDVALPEFDTSGKAHRHLARELQLKDAAPEGWDLSGASPQ